MKIGNFLLGCFIAPCMAMTPAEIQEEGRAFQALQKQALEMLQPIQDDIDAVRGAVRAPFAVELEPLNAQIETLHQEIRGLQAQHRELSEKFRAEVADLEIREKEESQEAIAPLREELEEKRKPIMAEVEELKKREAQILQECYQTKADPVWGKLWDGTDSLGVGLQCGIIEEKIEALYKGVDGDLPTRIRETQRAVEARYLEERIRRIAENDRAQKEIAERTREKTTLLDQLHLETSAIDRRQKEALDAAIPNSALVPHLAVELELIMISQFRGS